MKKIKITITLFISLFTLINLNAQEQFERLYRSTNWENYGLDIVQTNDNGFLLLSVGKHPDSIHFRHANITKLEPKGDIQWSKNYDFDDEILANGELTLLENDSFAFSTLCFKAIMNKVITKADGTGEVVWSKKVGEVDSSMFLNPSGSGDLLTLPDGGLAFFDLASNQVTGTDLLMTRLDTVGNLLWSTTYQNSLNGTIFNQQTSDAEHTLNNGFVLGGTVSNLASINSLILNLDSLGSVNWGKQYNLEIGNLLASQIRTVESTLDSGYVVGGSYTNTSQLSSGYVMKVDSIGRIVWTYLINDPNFLVIANVFINSVLPQNDGTFNILGVHNNPSTFITKPFVMNLSPDGTINWQNYFYENSSAAFNINLDLDNLIPTQDGGNAAFGLVYEATGINNTPIPYVLKIDQNGESSCQDTSALLAVPINVNVDSLDVTTGILTNIENHDLEAENYNQFDIPILSLDAPSFCEGEPILHTFDATVDGAVSYEWSTGDTTAMITVTQEGMYTVMVRVEKDICFTMCDTTMITIIGPPTAEIVPFFDDYCANGFVVLQAQGGGTVEWSTGETEPFLLVDELGTYSVTITNQCGSSSASITVDQFPSAPEISISSNTNNYCLDGTAILGVNGAEGAQSITWSPVNDAVAIIQVTDLDPVYSVIADWNFCGADTASIQLTPPVVSADISIEVDSFCSAGFINLMANYANAQSIEWSTGETTDGITISEAGTYLLTAISDFCDNDQAEIDITPCISPFDCVEIPNAFTPDGDEINDSFWPVIPAECADIQVVEIQIFSRWGELIFETTDPNQRWDGNYEDEPAASDVYVYSIRLVNGIGERGTRKGDLTLLR